MERTPVMSSNLHSVGYSQEENILEVAFKSGGIYQYFGVPYVLYERLMGAPSKGQFLHTHIKGHFRYRKIR